MAATIQKCRREECRRPAKGDEFCSTYCAKVVLGTYGPRDTSAYSRRKRRRLLEEAPVVEVENTDAMLRRVPGSFESGKRR